MAFLNPVLLYLLPLIGVPLIIHLFGRQRYRTVEFSSIRFLEQLKQDVIRRLKLRQIILLILRTLLITVLILAFARPYRTSRSQGLVVQAGETLYWVIDNSASMRTAEQGTNLLTRALAGATGLLGGVEYPVRFKWISTTQPQELHDAGLIRSAAGIEATLQKISGSFRQANIAAALQTVASDLAGRQENATIWVLSDFQRSHTDIDRLSGLTKKLFAASGARLVLLPFRQSQANFSLMTAEIVTGIIEKGQTTRLTTTVVSWGQSAPNRAVSLYLEDERVGQGAVDLTERGLATTEFEFIPNVTGAVNGRLTLPEDVSDADNVFYFSLFIPASIRVLIVSRSSSDGMYMERAFSSFPAGLFETRLVTLTDLPVVDLKRYELVWFLNIDDLPPVVNRRLHDFSATGGGLVVMPGSDCQPERFNRQWADGFGFPRWRLNRQVEGEGFLKIGAINTRHPIFQDLWRYGGGLNASPRFFRVPGFTLHPSHRAIVSYNDGTPLLIENHSVRGLLLGTIPAAGWSDLQFSGFFPALLYRMTLYLYGQQLTPVCYEVGDTLSWPELQGSTQIMLPSGRRFNVDRTPGQQRQSFSLTEESGIYTVFQGGQSRYCFAVNVPVSEKAADFLTPAELVEWQKNDPARIVILEPDQDGSLASVISRSEISPFLFWLVLALALAETYIGRINRRDT